LSHTRIKICGITRPEDALAAAELGADAIGLVFYPRSPRAVDAVRALEILAEVPPFLSVVALFVDEPAPAVHRILSQVPVDTLQFHGAESPDYCNGFGRPWLKALRVREGVDVAALARDYGAARAILLDSWQEGVPGGTGRTFDWNLAPSALARPVVLAGGLDDGNVGEAVRRIGPAAVDVSGGVESAPGVKDREKIRRFIAAVGAADGNRE